MKPYNVLEPCASFLVGRTTQGEFYAGDDSLREVVTGAGKLT